MNAFRARPPFAWVVASSVVCWTVPTSAQVEIRLTPDSLFLQTEGFPAISSDGGTLLLVSDVYSCCLDLGAEWVRIHTDAPASQDRLPIRRKDPERDLTGKDSLEQRRWTSATHRKAKDWLEGRTWESMVPVDWRKSMAKDSVLDPPMRDGSRTFSTWRSFQRSLPQMRVPCPDPGLAHRDCQVPNSIQNVWSHPRLRWVLVEYGYVSGGSRIDRGPFWKVLRH